MPYTRPDCDGGLAQFLNWGEASRLGARGKSSPCPLLSAGLHTHTKIGNHSEIAWPQLDPNRGGCDRPLGFKFRPCQFALELEFLIFQNFILSSKLTYKNMKNKKKSTPFRCRCTALTTELQRSW